MSYALSRKYESPHLHSRVKKKKLDTNDVCETVAVISNNAMRMRVLTHPAYTPRLIVACSQYMHHSSQTPVH